MTGRLDMGRRRWVVDYLLATQNEIAIDTIAFELAGVDPDDVGYFPRPSKWVRYVGRWPALWRAAWFVMAGLWRFGGAAAFHLLELVRYVAYARRHRATATPAASGNGYVLALSSRAGDIIRPPQIADIPTQWLTMPWAPIQDPPPGCRRVDLFSLLSVADLWASYVLAVTATRALARRRHSAKWQLQSYTAFRWFAARTALEKLDGPFFMAEHIDRWAILVDRVVKRRNRARGAADRMQLVLVQHGEVGTQSSAQWRADYYAKLRCRLESITALYAFDQASAAIFRESIFAPARRSAAIDVRYYTPRLELRRSPSRQQCRLLFVGHPICEPLHVHLLQIIRQHVTVEVFYKPHPKAPMSPEMNRYDWRIVADKSAFPEVDLLVSYPSTLVTEYAALGIPAAVHPLYLEVADCQEFAAKLLEQVRAVRAGCMHIRPSAA